MKQVQVLNNTIGVIELTAGINLMPGSNFVDLEIVNKLDGHEIVSLWKKKGLISIKEIVVSNDDAGDDGKEYILKVLNVNDAKEVIQQTFSVSDLNEWQERESSQEKPRKGVLNAIEAQLEEIDRQTVPNN